MVQLNHVFLSITKQSSGTFFGRCCLFDCLFIASIFFIHVHSMEIVEGNFLSSFASVSWILRFHKCFHSLFLLHSFILYSLHFFLSFALALALFLSSFWTISQFNHFCFFLLHISQENMPIDALETSSYYERIRMKEKTNSYWIWGKTITTTQTHARIKRFDVQIESLTLICCCFCWMCSSFVFCFFFFNFLIVVDSL